ncbi:cold shock domain-containing protein [Candidatus Woesearchaeota archaeon]|nr:cold shock domain-containing protein [Candidatus Woesearchaeota archaeon]
MKGNVKFFNQMKGFGFIAAEDGKEYFVHMSDLKDGVTIRDNDVVVFEVVQGDRGPKAAHVSLDDGSASTEAPQEEVQEEAPLDDANDEAEETGDDDSQDDDSAEDSEDSDSEDDEEKKD